ncbi:MAG TPA: hypothetical protein PLD20_12830 [Blastocatellia bacterium]|nr:hypothetical protein [Blastocatellia bacterium]HMV86871.1 hypothetical protein [Blastocatellia bacterium]HMX25369.1 hypothetical protein [Blastocatellia bacterium]HMZ18812.1 hypothetical protein [Blastocatellia bacterium]HNG29855.1 hypothetical protein [Blastocatellia bacterium]
MSVQNQIIACVVKQYGTGRYRSCVSLSKGNVICLSTHNDEQSATETINQFLQFWEACPRGETRQPEDVSLFIKSINGEMALAA